MIDHVWVATVRLDGDYPLHTSVHTSRVGAMSTLVNDHGAPPDQDDWMRFQGNQHRLTKFWSHETIDGTNYTYRVEKKEVES
jgi:hypothetical protein